MSEPPATAPSRDPLEGCLITLEGGEGVGKSTQIERLRDRLVARGFDVVATREPGGSPRAEAIRRVLLEGAAKGFGAFAETLLFASARAGHVDGVIAPALRRGAFVLCDRFIDSTRVYQGAVAAVPARAIHAFERLATRGVLPDLTLILDLSAELGLARAKNRRIRRGEGSDRFEDEAIAFHTRVRQAYLEIADVDRRRCSVIDAAGDAEEVSQRIWKIVAARILS